MRQGIPEKLYFRIGEVSELVGVKPYVLRYWESEFTDIRPTKSKSGQRLYKRRDVEQLMTIRELLHEKRFTIDGARKHLKDKPKDETSVTTQMDVFEPQLPIKTVSISEVKHEDKKIFKKIKTDLEELLQFVRE